MALYMNRQISKLLFLRFCLFPSISFYKDPIIVCKVSGEICIIPCPIFCIKNVNNFIEI